MAKISARGGGQLAAFTTSKTADRGDGYPTTVRCRWVLCSDGRILTRTLHAVVCAGPGSYYPTSQYHIYGKIHDADSRTADVLRRHLARCGYVIDTEEGAK